MDSQGCFKEGGVSIRGSAEGSPRWRPVMGPHGSGETTTTTTLINHHHHHRDETQLQAIVTWAASSPSTCPLSLLLAWYPSLPPREARQ